LNLPTILYGQLWEDPEVDLRALGITAWDRVLAVTSGGCTALTLLAEGSREVVCVDPNPAQNHLLELKLAAVCLLPLSVCRGFLGARAWRDRLSLYPTLASRLSPAARDFWDERPDVIEAGVLYAGLTEARVRRLRAVLFGWVHSAWTVRALMRQKDWASQSRFYREVWCNRRWERALRWAFRPWAFRLLFGRPFVERAEEGEVAEAWRKKIDRAFTDIPIRHNYFLSQMLWGRYLPGEESLPPYLREGVFERVRAKAPTLRWVTQDPIAFLAASRPSHFSKMTLSNAFEWLSVDQCKEAFDALVHALAPGGRAVLRHLVSICPPPVGAMIREDEALSQELTQQERAFLYTRVSVYNRL
jgi:S-adenosylmethionine-diacylglycerol 3-amino-3-carboxypropyl transferase